MYDFLCISFFIAHTFFRELVNFYRIVGCDATVPSFSLDGEEVWGVRVSDEHTVKRFFSGSLCDTIHYLGT